MNKGRVEAVIIGPCVADIPLAPVGPAVLDAGSWPLERIAMQVGGDAANEAISLCRLGHPAMLVSKVGRDAAGDFILRTLDSAGVDTCCMRQEEGLDTGINIVLVREDGERSFITNRNGSLRRLGPGDILPALEVPSLRGAKVACLASLFVSPMLTLKDTTALLGALKALGLLLCADTTRPKHGETLAEAGGALSRLDYFFPNLEEATLLTGWDDPDAAADALLACGVKHVALKLGRRGCLLADARRHRRIPAWPGARCVDTTGAGDTFAAAFIAALLEGQDFIDCGRYANAAASLCVEHVGANGGKWSRGDAAARMAEIDIP